MDTVTQFALGVTIAEVGWRRRLGGWGAAWGGLCGLAPDLDVVLAVIDPWADLVFHRSWTHSLILLPIAALPLGWLGLRVAKRGSVADWVHLCAWALVTHPLLDVFTFFGTQLLYPLADTRFSLDAVSAIDLIYSLPLLAVCIAALRRGDPPAWRSKAAAAALLFTSAYLGAGYVSMVSTRDAAKEDLRRQGIEAEEVRALPIFMMNQAFRIVARRGQAEYWLSYRSSLTGSGTRWLPVRSLDDPRTARVWQTERGRQFRWFSDDLVVVRPTLEQDRLEMVDLRFGGVTDPIGGLFAAEVVLPPEGQPTLERLPQVLPDDPVAELSALLEVLTTGGSAVWDEQLP